MNPLEICFILADKRVGNDLGRQQVEVDAEVFLLVR